MKKLFKAGLAALLPFLITLAVVYFTIKFLYSSIGDPLGRFTHSLIRPATEYSFIWSLIGFLFAFFLIFIIGSLFATYLGGRLYRLFEKIIESVPLLKSVYPYTKQIAGFILPAGGKKLEFKRPVIVPFPTAGIYSIGFVTSNELDYLGDLGKDRICVFVPTSPTPMSGFTVYTPRKDVVELPITVEEAMRIIISCGILVPTGDVDKKELKST